ncbi:MAG TPA: hypothetical protein DDW49_11400 [Deltaproteobacteria bacterium]|nr:MAG: hypothetical protein A2048_05610 [Deltaproteobacteria bacterium GWA2_45_12]HBF13972.1 hypothetical protein [Deltaproteobacteria bacterium]
MKETKILIVDDEKELCQGLEKLIGSQGYKVQSVFDGKKAVETIKKELFSLVILDLKLPGLSGEKVLRHLKIKRPKTKVIILTAHGTVNSAVKFLKMGVSQYLQKPFQPKQLIDLIQKEIGLGDEIHLTKELYCSIGSKIRNLRGKEGWTIQQLAERIGISTSLVSQVENGKLSASLGTLLKISQGFRIPIKQLF